jgi:hypothetical protein
MDAKEVNGRLLAVEALITENAVTKTGSEYLSLEKIL